MPSGPRFPTATPVADILWKRDIRKSERMERTHAAQAAALRQFPTRDSLSLFLASLASEKARISQPGNDSSEAVPQHSLVYFRGPLDYHHKDAGPPSDARALATTTEVYGFGQTKESTALPSWHGRRKWNTAEDPVKTAPKEGERIWHGRRKWRDNEN